MRTNLEKMVSKMTTWVIACKHTIPIHALPCPAMPWQSERARMCGEAFHMQILSDMS